MPMVMALLGTCSSPKKSLAASTRVTLSKYTALVRVCLSDLRSTMASVPNSVCRKVSLHLSYAVGLYSKLCNPSCITSATCVLSIQAVVELARLRR